MTKKVKLVRTSPDAVLPERGSEEAAGLDLCSAESYIIEPGDVVLINTGWKISVPSGYEAQVRSRSGNVLKKQLVVMNQPGTVDSDYRGPLGVILHNASKGTKKINVGDRVAQMVIQPVTYMSCEEVEEFPDNTERGEGGFGSTGY